MKKIALLSLLLLVGCGYNSRDGEAIGQAKKLTNVTPIFCDGYTAFDMSLGVMKGGSGSMSTQDVWFTVRPGVDLAVIKKAVANAAIVRVRYDSRRLPICTEPYMLNSIEIVEQ